MRAWLEFGAVFLTGLLFWGFVHVGAKGLFIAVASVSWMSYIVWRVRSDSSLLEKWGFHAKNLLPAFVWPTVIFVIGVVLMAGYGMAHGRILWPSHLFVLLMLYPAWGILQQFLVQALGVANLVALFPGQGRMVAMPVGVLLFSLVHYPDGWVLMVATGVMACFFIPCYLRDRNLWPLGLYHGWLGTFFYLWVLGKDPWIEVFGK
ncbi:MAG: hypothetical protein OEZ57_04240 [Nitrospirota bacterium]|nr:hypothetical protein [Nitrospirota bacterium]MDH5586187.1 hypothetical protein [Nitrospirota bacterium]MDH5774109.1 hypothetical protein [Nitrospirota bacterium]